MQDKSSYVNNVNNQTKQLNLEFKNNFTNLQKNKFNNSELDFILKLYDNHINYNDSLKNKEYDELIKLKKNLLNSHQLENKLFHINKIDQYIKSIF